MTGLVVLGVAIALVSIGGSAYLLQLWHEDQHDLIAHGEYRGLRSWPLSRVLAYVAVGACVSSNVLAAVTGLRLLGLPNFEAVRTALQPLTLASLIFLDVAFTIIALYLRIVRARSRDG